MDWGFLSFLAEPWFVIPWYAIGVIGFFYVIYDINKYNTPLKVAMKWAWPIIVLFFSVVGLGLYFGTARAPGVAKTTDEKQRKQAHMDYEKNMFRRVNGAVIHCVAGDGLGIMTAMVIARAVGMSFWQEFWFEYLAGFLFGWFIFQFRSMMMMTDSKLMALAMAFRAEFFSMLTVMAGMGAVMAYVTPLTVTEQPKPLTFAFWGFGMFGLLVGYVFTWPMNYMMVKIGWKHGMGGMEAGKKRQVKSSGPRYGLLATMGVLGAVALVIPAWLAELRDGRPIQAGGDENAVVGLGTGQFIPGQGIKESLATALNYLQRSQRSNAVHALDAAHRAVVVADNAVPGTFNTLRHDIEQVRHELQMGRDRAAREKLSAAADLAGAIQVSVPGGKGDFRRFKDALVLDEHGVEVGEVISLEAGRITVALGGARNVWGFLDLGSGRTADIPVDALALGPSRLIGASLVAVPTESPA